MSDKNGLNVTAPKEEKKPNKLDEKVDAILDGVLEVIKAVGELNKKIEAMPTPKNLENLANAGNMGKRKAV